MNKANVGGDEPDVYTRQETDMLLLGKANVGPYPVYNAPITSGYNIEGVIEYYKDGSDNIFVWVELKRSSGTIASDFIIGTLPAGFRPRTGRRLPAQGYPPVNRSNIILFFHPDGSIAVQYDSSVAAPQYIYCFAGFPPA